MVNYNQMQTSIVGLLQVRRDALSTVVDEMTAAGVPTADLQSQLQSYTDSLTIVDDLLTIQYGSLNGIIASIELS